MSLFESAQNQVKQMLQLLPHTEFDCERLLYPERFIEFNFPVLMDSGHEKIFTGFRSLHNTTLGPGKGGIRFHNSVDADEIKTLSMWMSWKCALAGIPFGGAKGGVRVDPKQLSEGELERLTRAYTRLIAPYIGFDKDVPAPDMNTDGQILDWMVDEYTQFTGLNGTSVFTGKTVQNGGSEGRIEATGYGVARIALHAIEDFLNRPLDQVSVAIQGIGNVGRWAAINLYNEGTRIIAVSDSQGTVICSDGLDLTKVLEHKDIYGNLMLEEYEYISDPQTALFINADVVIPAALENQITNENVNQIKARLIVEAANGPTTPEADKVLSKQSITVIPDILANAGGVIVSYFEWLQNKELTHWSRAEVIAKLNTYIDTAYMQVKEIQNNKKTTMREAAYVYALQKIISSK